MADYGETVLQGMQVGSSIYSRGADLALRRQQLQSEAATRQLQNEHIAQQMRLEMEQHDLDAQARAASESAIKKAQMEAMPFYEVRTPTGGSVQVPNPIQKPTWQAYQDNLLPVAAKFGGPKAAEDIVHNTVMMRMYEAHAHEYEKQAAAANFTPGFQTLNDPSGNPHTVFQGSKNTAQLVEPPEIKNLTNPDTGETTTVLIPGGRGGGAKTLSQDIKGRQLQVEQTKRLAQVAPQLLEWDDKAQALTFPKSPDKIAEAQKALAVGSGITTATRTKLEQSELESLNVFNFGQKLAPLLTPENVGVRGNVNRLIEGVATQFAPSMKIGKATETVSAAFQFQQSLTKALKSDSNIAEAERKTIEASLPQVGEWTQSAQTARVKLALALENWGTKSRQNAQALHKQIAPNWMMPDEIQQALVNKDIDRAQASKLLDGNGWILVRALRESAQR